MPQTEQDSGWLAMYVASTDTGYTIEFLNINDGFGALSAATTIKSPDKPLFAGQSWVHPSELKSKLLRFMQTTADLAWLPDFEDTPNDEHGAPIIWSHITLCLACNARSKIEASKRIARTTCSKCKSVIDIFPETITWIGPNSPHLIELWHALPSPNAEQITFGDGFTASDIPSGALITDPLGNKIQIMSTVDGLSVQLHHHNDGRTLALLLNGAGFRVIDKERE